jgi:Fanconi anemia group M protein
MKNNDIIKVFVDSREQKVGKQSVVFFNNQNIMAEEHANKDGDLLFILKDGVKLYIERKSYSDFASSYIKGHIQDQAIRLSEYPLYACIVHGNINDLKKVSALRRLQQSSIDKMTHNLMLFYHLPIFFVDNVVQYLKLSLELAQSVVKHKGQNIEALRLGSGFKNRPDISILSAQNSIGYKTSDMLLKEFGSPQAVLNASRKDLLKIKGVGDSTISKIKELKDVYENGVIDGKKI